MSTSRTGSRLETCLLTIYVCISEMQKDGDIKEQMGRKGKVGAKAEFSKKKNDNLIATM